MNPLLPCIAALIAAVVLLLHILLRTQKAPEHWLLCALLAGVACWSSGIMMRLTVTSIDGLRAAVQLVLLGVLIVPVVWLLLAGLLTRARFVDRPASIAMLCTPPALMYLCLITNEGHGLFIRDMSFSSLEQGPPAFGGPVYWMAVVWSYLCVGSALWLKAKAAFAGPSWAKRAVLGAALIPVLLSLVWVTQVIPVSHDLTPFGLAAGMLVLCVAAFRYQFLEVLPLAHHTVVDHLEDGVIMANPAGRIVDCNPTAARLVGEGAEALRGRALDDILASLHRAAEGGSPSAIDLTEGEVNHVDGHTVGRFALLLDRGEERRSEQLVQRAQRLETVGALASGIAHEINDPLAFACSNLSELVRMGEQVEAAREGPDADLARELEDLHTIAVETLDGVERMARIAADMRSLTTGPNLSWDLIDLTSVVRDAMRIVRIEEGATGFETAFAEGGVWVRGTAERLVQVVVNLLANARQAISESGRVRVEVCGQREMAQIVVEDDGPGIPEAIREHVFDPFFTTKSPDAGSGLGLAIAYDIARDHGGVLEECGEPGGGARFVLRLPRVAQLDPTT